MNFSCKICDSDRKEFIEELILKGESNKSISDKIKSIGIDISHATVNRHKTKHMLEHIEKINELATPKNNTKYDRNDNVNIINVSDIFRQVNETALKSIDYTSIAEKYSKNHIMLERIVSNQLAITIILQEKFIDGECKYPHEQIRGLQIVQELIQKFEVFNRNSFVHYNDIFKNPNKIEHLRLRGYQEKINMPKYNKGDIFKLLEIYPYYELLEQYYEKYIPKNPYKGESLDDESEKSYNAFNRGIDDATKVDETLDLLIIERIVDMDENQFDIVIKLLKSDYTHSDVLTVIGDI